MNIVYGSSNSPYTPSISTGYLPIPGVNLHSSTIFFWNSLYKSISLYLSVAPICLSENNITYYLIQNSVNRDGSYNILEENDFLLYPKYFPIAIHEKSSWDLVNTFGSENGTNLVFYSRFIIFVYIFLKLPLFRCYKLALLVLFLE